MPAQLTRMTRGPIRLLFCLATAVLGASIADPLVEGASNAGWFGAGRYTDGSTVDVLPALLLGLFAVLFNVGLRAHASFERTHTARSLLCASEEALSCGITRLLPLAFALQIGVLFGMETTEQFVVWHHSLGGTVWLGGPIAVSFGTHLAICAAVLCAFAACIRALAATAVRIIRTVCGLVRQRTRKDTPLLAPRRGNSRIAYRSVLAYSNVGQRAPPSLLNVLPLATLGEFICLLIGQFEFPSSSLQSLPACS